MVIELNIDELIENKPLMKILLSLALVVFSIGFVLSVVSVNEKRQIVYNCNEHWKNQIRREEKPALTLDNIYNFTKDYAER